MDRAIRLLKDEKDKLQGEAERNHAEIKKLQDKNTCLSAQIEDVEEALSRLTVVEIR